MNLLAESEGNQSILVLEDSWSQRVFLEGRVEFAKRHTRLSKKSDCSLSTSLSHRESRKQR